MRESIKRITERVSKGKGSWMLFAVGCLLAFGPREVLARPNIIFIMADDMRRDMFNFLPEHAGKSVSPNLDRLASEGMVFPQFHAASSACTPSRFNVLCGRYGSREQSGNVQAKILEHDFALVGWNTHIVPGDVTVAKLLKQAGYSTGFVGKNHVVDVPNYDKRIPVDGDLNDPDIQRRLRENADYVEAAIRNAGFDYAASIYHKNPNTLAPSELAVHNMEWITKGGLDFIDQYKDRPFFLFFATTQTHLPYEEELSWNANPLATAEGMLDAPLNVLPDRSTIIPRLQAGGVSTVNDDLRPHLLQLDDCVGALMDKLEQHQLDDDTIIFFFNDHGVEEGKSTCYEGGTLAMTMVWKKSGFSGGGWSEAKISNVDFAPTILDYTGVDVPFNQFNGKSFRPILEGLATEHYEDLFFEMGCARGILHDNWKYIAVRYPVSIVDPEGNGVGQVTLRSGSDVNGLETVAMNAHPAYFERDQLYDLSADPQELNNLAHLPEHAARIADMQQRLKRHINPLPGGFSELKTTNDELHRGTVLSIQ